MRAQRGLAAAFATCVLACMVYASVTGAAPSSVFDARISMDTVDIRVDASPAGRTLILDDEKLPYASTIRNAGQDCYIRVKVQTEAQGESIPAEIVLPDDGRWSTAPDGWTYYRPILADGDSVTLSSLIGNPMRDWDGSGFPVQVCTIAQAVQAENIEPDYESAEPWGSTQACTTRYFRDRS